jgi:hypothetical protein
MIANLPNWINVLFLLITALTIVLFYYSNGKPKKTLVIILAWSVLQSVLAYVGFYENMSTIPPRFTLVLLPVIVLISYVLLSKNREEIIANRNIKISTFLHVIRIPVEIVLLYLFFYKMLPQLATFEGRNFDILSGITAPIIGFLYLKNRIGNKVLIVWNVICLGLVLFILVNGILSAELFFQQFAFDQPNKAVKYFPFILLPAVVVPIVVYTHIVDIMKLRREKP